MSCRSLPIVVTAAVALSVLPAGAIVTAPKRASAAPLLEPAMAFERPDAKELVRQAKDLWLVKEDFSGALAKFDAAVAMDPADPDTRLQRAHFFEVLALIVVPREKAKFAARAKSDFETIVAADPESMIAGVARDGLTRMSGEPLIVPRMVECPAAASKAHARANAFYGSHRYADAAVEYGRAAAGCPEEASWWSDLADANYELEDYEQAKGHFMKALSVDPWNREAHRYLSDTHVQLGNDEAAVHELVMAVISDPTYEAGWLALRAYATAMGTKWNRVYGDRRPVEGNADGAAWAAYAAAKRKARETRSDSASALALEREAVKAALGSAAGGLGPFWSMLARADRAGYLDEAIFFHLLDAGLAAEYPAFREKNTERLEAYLETLILR